MRSINHFNHPICLTRPPQVNHASSWVEHIPFALYLVDIACPRVFVELGAQTGISYFAFCQAIKQLGWKNKVNIKVNIKEGINQLIRKGSKRQNYG